MKLKIGKDDGFGNVVDEIELQDGENGTPEIVLLDNMNEGDIIYIHNKEGCRIATYIVK